MPLFLEALVPLAAAAGLIATGCRQAPSKRVGAALSSDAPAAPAAAPASAATLLTQRALKNRAAYVPPQCFARTQGENGRRRNPCYVCHTRSERPNYADDEDLQLSLKLPLADRVNPWMNLLSPPVARSPLESDEEILGYVRQSNYFDRDGGIRLARRLQNLPPDWDGSHTGRWAGFVPDVSYRFDDKGFDRRSDGTPSGWRAFGYYPFPGTFFPTNGSGDDILIRLDPALQQTTDGGFDITIYTVNLAIVEALITRRDIAIDPVDEAPLGVDLDLDGHVGRATRVAFDDAGDGMGGTRMRYVGRASVLHEKGQFPIAVGLFPLGTEFFHTVRYLDIAPDGGVTLAPRMKELRYARKARWVSYDRLKAQATREAHENARTPDRTHRIQWFGELGVSNEQGWYFQGFIEEREGALRPQSMEESAACEGCHGGIGVTTDSIFSFGRKLAEPALARGWFHWSQHDLRGLPEPRRRDGQFEYTLYLREAGAGDDFRSNEEVMTRFFDQYGDLRPSEVQRLHSDISRLLLPTAARALALDRAYRAIVLDQSFDRGRDALLAPSPNILSEPAMGERTGIERPIVAMRLAP